MYVCNKTSLDVTCARVLQLLSSSFSYVIDKANEKRLQELNNKT